MLVLASSSPRRQELLRNAGFEFVVQPANIPEELQEGETPKTFTERLAREKALAAFRQRAVDSRNNQEDIVLGADTVVIIDDQILCKPEDAEEAFRMLRKLSGRTHQVTTGVCLVGKGFCDVRSETASVTMAQLSDDDIRAYVATGESFDKAGGYGIQGVISRWIARIDGNYFNVVGLPVSLVYQMLRDHGAI
jgi:septum formation protein